MDIQEIKQGLQLPGKSRSGLAERLGVDVSQISRLLNGKRQLKVNEVPIIREYLYGAEGNEQVGPSSQTNGSNGVHTPLDTFEALKMISNLIDRAQYHHIDVAATIIHALSHAIQAQEQRHAPEEKPADH